MKIRFVLGSLLICLLSFQPLSAQYLPDTSLTYESFLRQCRKFSELPREEVWVVNFWASWNTLSLEQIPQIKTARLRYVNKPVRFISISIDKDRTVWESMLDYYQIPWENMFLPSESDYSFLKRAFKHNALPALYIVNQGGNITRIMDMDNFYRTMDQQTRELPNQPYSGFSEIATAKPNLPPPAPTGDTSPTQPAVDSGTVQNGWVMHKVLPGETLFSLYRKYDVKVELIKQRNGMTSNTIKVGQVLKIKPAS